MILKNFSHCISHYFSHLTFSRSVSFLCLEFHPRHHSELSSPGSIFPLGRSSGLDLSLVVVALF